MKNDTIAFIKIIVIAVATSAVIIYFVVRNRSKRYIVYADNEGIKTAGGKIFNWQNLQRVHYLNKRIIGGGLAEKNYAILFYFAGGKAETDINSTIYHYLLDIAKKVKVPSTSVVTKGFFKSEK